jgi:hypothetical protein
MPSNSRPLTLDKARAEGRLAEFIEQQHARYPKGADKAEFDKLIGKLAKPDKQPKVVGRTSRRGRAAG